MRDFQLTGTPNLVALISECFALLITGSYEQVEPFPRSEIGKMGFNQRFPKGEIHRQFRSVAPFASLTYATAFNSVRLEGGNYLPPTSYGETRITVLPASTRSGNAPFRVSTGEMLPVSGSKICHVPSFIEYFSTADTTRAVPS